MLWADQNDSGLDLRVNLSRVATPFENCVKVSPGPVERESVAELERRRFDQAPVVGPHSVDGIVDTAHLRKLLDQSRPLELDDPAITFSSLNKESTLREVFDALVVYRAALIVIDTGQIERNPDNFIGLMTISDLNRHAFRSVIYALLAELETSLADLIEREFVDPWEWIRLIPEESRVIVLGRWELDKRKGADVGPIVGTTLSNVLRIAKNSNHVQELLGFTSKTKLDNHIGDLPDLRNRVMHPVRPVVESGGDVDKLRSLLDRAIELTSRAYKAMKSIQ